MKLIEIHESNEVDRIEIELLEDYPVSFSIDEFKNINSYAGRIRYAKEKFGKPIGSGSSRIVYRIDKDKVLKIAKNGKGIVQNRVESQWAGEHYYDDITAKVFDFDEEKLTWIEMEIAYRAKKSDFKRLWGVDFDNLGDYLSKRYWENHGRSNIITISDEVKNQFDECDDVQHLVAFMYDVGLLSGDLSRLNSWGRVNRSDGEYLVLIDFGFDEEAYKMYYGVK